MIFKYLLFLFLAIASYTPALSAARSPKLYVRKPQSAVLPATLCPQQSEIVKIPFKPLVAPPLIIIDPGHGGEDFGTHSLCASKYQEKYLNLSTSKLIRGFLQQFGYSVYMTRTDDTFISLEERSQIANKRNPVLFISMHYNSAPSPTAEGIEIFYYRDDSNKVRTHKSKLLAHAILDKTLQTTQAKSRGVKQGNLSVIRETNMPAILIEGGFMTCASEMDRIKKASYQKSLAMGIAQGIQDYLDGQGLQSKK